LRPDATTHPFSARALIAVRSGGWDAPLTVSMTVTADALYQARPRPGVRPLMSRSDDALRAMAARGDADAFGAIYERHHQALHRYCSLILGHADDAGDAVHNTMANAWEALRRAEPTVPLRPWLCRIAHNESVSLLRKRRADGPLDDASISSTGDLEETLELRERLATLRADLAALPERQRGALVLRELCGLSHNEIAAVLATSVATARQTIYEARLALFEAEAGRGMACDAIQRALSDGDGRSRRGRKIRAHLRTCEPCTAFAARIRRHPTELAALAPPVSTGASLGALARLLPQTGASEGISSVAAGTATGTVASVMTAVAALTKGTATKVLLGSVVAAVGGVAGANRAVTVHPQARTPAMLADAHGSSAIHDPPYRERQGRPEGSAQAPASGTPVAARVPSSAPAPGTAGGPVELPPPPADPVDDPSATGAAAEGQGVDAAPQTATSAGDAQEPTAVAHRPQTAPPPVASGTVPIAEPSARPVTPVAASTSVPGASHPQDSGAKPAEPAVAGGAGASGSASGTVGLPDPVSKGPPEPRAPSSKPLTPASPPSEAPRDEASSGPKPPRVASDKVPFESLPTEQADRARTTARPDPKAASVGQAAGGPDEMARERGPSVEPLSRETSNVAPADAGRRAEPPAQAPKNDPPADHTPAAQQPGQSPKDSTPRESGPPDQPRRDGLSGGPDRPSRAPEGPSRGPEGPSPGSGPQSKAAGAPTTSTERRPAEHGGSPPEAGSPSEASRTSAPSRRP
jgi:RNA polymerase sigma factor (sigma-70 family)